MSITHGVNGHARQADHSLIGTEQDLLRKLLARPEYIGELDLQANRFTGSAERITYNAILNAYFNGAGDNLANTVVASIGNQLEAIGGIQYLSRLLDDPLSGCGIKPTYEAGLLETAYKRRIGRAAVTQIVNGLQEDRDPEELLAEAAQRLQLIGNDDAKPSFRVMTAAELAASNITTEFIVEDLLVKGQPCVAAADKKCLKTSIIALEMGISIASGMPVLGKFTVNEPMPVLVMSGESGVATIKETLWRICESKGIALKDVARFLITTDIPKFNSVENLRELQRLMRRLGVGVLIIDPAYLCMDGEGAGSIFSQGNQLLPITKICHDAGVTLIVIHHNRKNGKRDRFAPPELEDIAWAGFAEFFRQWLLLGRREEYVPGTGEHRLWLNVGGSAGHSSLWGVDVAEGVLSKRTPRHWEAKVMLPHEAKQAAQQSEEAAKDRKQAGKIDRAKRQLCEALRTHGDCTKSELRERTGIETRIITPALVDLLAQRYVELVDVYKKNRKSSYEGYRLTEAAEDFLTKNEHFTAALEEYNKPLF